MNHGSINNYAYSAESDNNTNSSDLLTYAAQQQPNSAATAKHLPYLSNAVLQSPPANGDRSPSNQTNLFFNNFFGNSQYDLSKNSGVAQTAASRKVLHDTNKIIGFSSAALPLRMADAGEQPQINETLSHNEALHKLRQKCNVVGTGNVTGGQPNPMPDYNTRFPHYLNRSSFTSSSSNDANTSGSTVVYNANNVNGNTNIRWLPNHQTTTIADAIASSSSPAYASSNASRQSGGDNSSRAAEQLPLLPSNVTNDNNKCSFSSSSGGMPPHPNTTATTTNSNAKSSFLGFTLQQQQQNSHTAMTVNSSPAKASKHSVVVALPKTPPNRYAPELANEKLPQLCALANSLQSVSSSSLINNKAAVHRHSGGGNDSNKRNDESTNSNDDAGLSSNKRASEFVANADLPRLLSKLTGSTATATTRKRAMNEESNALESCATEATDNSGQHCSGAHGCGVRTAPVASAAAAAVVNASSSNNVNSNQHQQIQQQQVNSYETSTIGTTQKKSRFRIGSLAINRKASVVADESTAARAPAAAPVQHTHAPTLPTLQATAHHHHQAAKTSNENFDSIIAASSSNSNAAVLSSSSKIGVDETDQTSPRNRVMSPNTAIRKYGSRLSNYELGEIKNYSRIYFVGQRADKIDASSTKSRNYGYDNEDGLYLLRRRDQIAYRFEIIDKLGQGSFGQVVRAYDHKDGMEVALKILRNRRKFYRQGLVEVKLLEIVKRKDNAHNNNNSDPSSSLHNVVHMMNHFIFRNHLCISFELLGSNLYEVLQKNHFQGFNVKAVRNIAHQILACLQLLRRERIIHCDLKPENILINPNRPDSIAVKVVDFGSGCLDNQKLYTYIQSRYYRSPEVIMGLAYTMAIDMWSLGCILSELHTGRPLFPGEDEDEQLSMMMEVLGVPPQSVIAQGTRSSRFFDSCGQPIRLVNSRGRKRVPASKELSRAICASDKHFIDFLSKSFSYDADTRLTPDEGLRHEFIAPPSTTHVHHHHSTSSSSSGGGGATTTATSARQSAIALSSSSGSAKAAGGGATTTAKNWASAKSGR